MAQQYYKMEEAAQKLGITVEELRRLREDGTLRGFADVGGSWKFRAEDVDKLAAQRAGQAPAEPAAAEDEDLVLLTEADLGGKAGPIDEGAATVIGSIESPSDSDVKLVADQGTTEDSDVKLVPDTAGDSDVRLIGEPPAPSDSDVKGEKRPTVAVVGPADSDVRLVDDETVSLSGSGSADSDVRMMTEEPEVSDSGVQFVEDSEAGLHLDVTQPPKAPTPADSDVTLVEMPAAGDSAFGSGDSDISLSNPADSGISLEAPVGPRTQMEISLGEEEEHPAAVSKDIHDDTDFEVEPIEGELGSSGEIGVAGEESSEVTEEVGSGVAVMEEDAESGSEVVALEGEGEASGAAAVAEELAEEAAAEEAPAVEEEAPVAAPAPVGLVRPAAVAVAPMGTAVTVGLVASCVVLVLGGLFVFELFRNQFTGLEGTPYVSWLLEAIGLGSMGG